MAFEEVNFQPKTFSIQYNQDQNPFHFKIATTLEDSIIKDLRDKCFDNDETFIIIEWKNKDEKKQLFDKFINQFTINEEVCLYNMRKSALKYLLYQYKHKDTDIWDLLKNSFLENYFFIEKIKELMAKNKEKYEVCYELIYETFTDEKFDMSNIKDKYNASVGLKNEKGNLFKEFLICLFGNYNENKKFQIREMFNKQKIHKKEKLLKSTAIQFMKIQKLFKEFPKDFAKEIYFLSLEQNIPFIKYFKDDDNYKKKFNDVKTSFFIEEYKQFQSEKDNEIIDDLFAYSIFKNNNEINQYKFKRYPLWLIIKLYYIKKTLKNECFSYFKLMLHQIENKKKCESPKDKSLLQTSVIILEEHINETLATKYFKLIENTKEIKFDITIFETDVLIKNLVENKIEKNIETIMKNVSNNEELEQKLKEAINKELNDINTSLKNKWIFKYKNETNIQKILDDFIKKKTISIKPIEETLPELILKKLKATSTLPYFLDHIIYDEQLMLEVLKIKEPFLNNNKQINNVLKYIIKYNKQSTNIKTLQQIYQYVNENVIELKLLSNIQNLQSKMLYTNNEDSQIKSINEEFTNLIKNFPIPLNNLNKNYNDFLTFFKFANELSKRLNCFNTDFLNIKFYHTVLTSIKDDERKLVLEGEDSKSSNLIKDFMQKQQFKDVININSINQMNSYLNCEIHQFLVKVLKMCYHKYKTNKNIIKEIIKFLFMRPEISFEGISLYQQIIGDLISLNIEKIDNHYQIKNNDIFEGIQNNSNEILEEMFKFVLKDTSSTPPKKIKQITDNIMFMLIQSIERYFLKLLSPNNFLILDDENIKTSVKKSFDYIQKLNDNMKKQTFEQVKLFQQYIAISFIKVYFQVYVDILISDSNTSYCNWISDYISEHKNKEVVYIIEFYILKLIRNKYCNSFKEFNFFNYSRYQILWVSNLFFQGSFKSEYEFLFISDWNEENANAQFNYFETYTEFVNQSFESLRASSFRNSNYNDIIITMIQNKYDLYIDVIMNCILCHTHNEDYISKMEYIEFCSWSKYIIRNINLEKEELKIFINFLSTNCNIKQKKFCYSDLLKSIKETKSDNEITLIDIEIIFISLKFVLALIFNDVKFPLNNIAEISEKTYKSTLINKLSHFIVLSTEYYVSLNKCKEIFECFSEIKDLLRLNNINQIKLYMNFLYSRIKHSNTVSTEQLRLVIEQSINDWPNQTEFINKYYDFVEYNQEKIRNLLIEERYTPEALNGKICNIQNKQKTDPLIIPVYQYFYYEEFPSWNHFCWKYSSKINKDQYPYISFFKEEENQKYYGKKMSFQRINQILNVKYKNKEEKNYYDFKYSRYDSLDELVAYYSKSGVFKSKDINPHLGYLLEYDVDKIENELSSLELFIVEST